MAEQSELDNLSLDQIGDGEWDDRAWRADPLAETIAELRGEPIGLFGTEEIRDLLEWRQGLEVLIPRALSLLEKDPFVAVEPRSGDVLAAVLLAPLGYWAAHRRERARLETVMTTAAQTARDCAHGAWTWVGPLIVQFRVAEAAPEEFGPDTPSLEQIEGEFWGEARADTTSLVRDIHRLRQTPIGVLGVEGVRQLLEQHVGIPVLVPRALTYLEVDPLVEGIYYPGDLLAVTLEVPASYWDENSVERGRLDSVCAAALAMDDEILQDLVPELLEQIKGFRAGEPA